MAIPASACWSSVSLGTGIHTHPSGGTRGRVTGQVLRGKCEVSATLPGVNSANQVVEAVGAELGRVAARRTNGSVWRSFALLTRRAFLLASCPKSGEPQHQDE